MPAPDEITLFVAQLSAMGAAYMVTGATAAILYGQPRVTNGLDVVIALGEADLPGLAAAFPESEFYRPPEEVVGSNKPAINAAISASSTTRAATRPTSTWSATIRCIAGHCRFDVPLPCRPTASFTLLRPSM